MAIPGGRSPLSVYKELIRMHKEEQLSFRNVVVFVEYEFFPLVSPSAGNVAQLKEALLDHIDIAPENVYAPRWMYAERCHHRFLPDVRRKHP